jgi:hypothetical protein
LRPLIEVNGPEQLLTEVEDVVAVSCHRAWPSLGLDLRLLGGRVDLGKGCLGFCHGWNGGVGISKSLIEWVVSRKLEELIVSLVSCKIALGEARRKFGHR